ncbi:fumarylacetoacetate hydrolase protein [Pyrenophora tritici-repentis]|nr:fumarylacetoacetate hydrolase protein [Pyrenophora tritici-repentis]KAI0610882.1 fumarylacetoacetate hydrolase protein [Pyrenophora tritici-repentis]KAI0625814.1 fumarylacetoacetate hydrolase protein [Pyrenophora tritici-repentis]
MASLKSWFSIPSGSHFSLANIPFGVISTPSSKAPRVAVAIGEHALDLEAFAANNGFLGLSTIQPHQAVFSQPSLNAFAALGRPIHSVVRKYIQTVFSEETTYPDVLKNNAVLQKQVLIPLKDIKAHLPFKIGDYTDFFVGLNHAYNCGVIFRGAQNALNPNYKHLPVGYHGRASSIVPSGTPIRRPNGQILLDPTAEKKVPTFSPCKKLDFELELGAFVCGSNEQGVPIPVDQAAANLFGVVLMNDWSARDVQAWESTPLGPFNAKNFGTTISTWVVLADALEPFKTKGIDNDMEILPYLREKEEKTVYDINLEVNLKTSSGNTATVTKTNARHLLWSFPQMLAHHTITGCPFQPGDLLGSGTISGTSPAEFGSLLEQSSNGKNSIVVGDSEKRTFLEDGDQVTIRGVCGTDDQSLVGFGDCVGRIEPALTLGFA